MGRQTDRTIVTDASSQETIYDITSPSTNMQNFKSGIQKTGLAITKYKSSEYLRKVIVQM